MKVTTPGGEVIDLGTTETTPTIGIKDYSRRVTDDYGVTTVVPRNFSRRMSVRLGLAVDAVDALQRRLADLRATSARWVADRRYAALSVRGFFSDFSIDLPGAPLSYCTLTIEGLVENEALPDNGADPAPYGRSTMQVLAPIAITDASLVASSVSETDHAAWSNSLSYGKGARVILAATHRIYESAVDGNAGNDPAGTSGKWLDIGPTNRWAMFDQALGSTTTAQGSITVTITGAAIGAIALLDVDGATVRVQTASYDRTVPVGAGATTFLDLPPATTRASVTITGAGTVSVGTLLAGKVVGLGITEAGAGAGITDYSRKEVDDFGAVTIVERAWAKRMTAKTLINTTAIDAVFGRLAAVRATPVLWMGSKGLDSLTIYGFFKDFSIEVGETLSKVSLSIEGLSTAGKVEPFAPGGGSVAWPDITDPDGTKPKPNADQTGLNTSKDTAAVGGKPSGQVLTDISSIDARAKKLETETIPAINKAVAGADDRIKIAQYAADQAGRRAESAFDEIATKTTDLQEQIDVISSNGGYNDTEVKASIEEVRKTGVGNKDAIAQLTTEVRTSVGDLDTKYDAAITTTARTAASDTRAVAERLDDFIAQGGGGSDGVDTVARSEIQRVERLYVEADKSLAESIKTVTSRIDIIPASFRLVSRGANTPIPAGQSGSGLYNASGQSIVGANRGWNVAVWNAQNQVAQTKTFDTLDGLYDGGAQPMADFLNALPVGTTITIHTFDEPYINHMLPALIDAIARCGAGAAYTSQAWAYRGAYVLVGRAGIGRGNGVEIYRGTPAGPEGPTDAYISHGFSLLGGVPQASGAGSVIEATAKDLTTAFTKGDQALASRQELLEATAGAGGNLVPNSALSTLDGWSVNYNADNLTALYLNLAGTPWMLGGVENNLTLFRAAAGNGLCAQALSSRFAVRGGSFLQFYAMTANHRCNVWTSLFFFRADGSDAGYAGENTSPRINEGGQNIAAWDTTGLKAVQVPGDAVSACFAMRIYNVSSDGYGWFSRPFVTEVKQGAASWVAYSPGNDRAITNAISASVKSTADALADLPNRYAAASSVNTIEAQLRREQPSALNSYVDAVSGKADQVRTDMVARIEDRASAIADSKVGAVTQSVGYLRSEYNGTVSTVERQAGTIVDLQSRASAYIKLVADAGGGVGSFSLWSDQFGGAWELAGNGRIRGNLVLDGTLTGAKIASDAIAGFGNTAPGSLTMRDTVLRDAAAINYPSSGGSSVIIFSGIVTLSPGAPAGTRLSAYLSIGGAIVVGPLQLSATRGSPVPFCFTTLQTFSGTQRVVLSVQATNSVGSGDPHIIDAPTIVLTEFKKLGV